MPNDTIRVLLVDDALERDDRVDEMLAAAGFETRAVNDSVSAAGALDIWRPSVVVVDLRYPAREARHFCEDLAARPAEQRPSVVLISEGANLIKETPIVPDGLLATPVVAERLAATVQRTVRDATATREASLGAR